MVLRHVRPGDEDLLLQIFSDPTVSRWWGDPDKSVADTMDSEEGDDHYLIEVDGEAVGMIQSYQETDEMYRHAGIDISIREPWQGNMPFMESSRPAAGKEECPSKVRESARCD